MKIKKYIIFTIITVFLFCFSKVYSLNEKNGLVCENNRCYFFENGIKQVGFQEIEGKTYFFSRVNDNAMKYGWQFIDGYYYYFDSDGALLTGNQIIDNRNVDLDETGKLKKGILTYNTRTYYYDNYAKQLGFQEIEGKTYFFSRVNDNAMKTGMIWIDDDYYYFDVDNGMQMGLHQINDKYYYFGIDGKRKKGFQEVEDKTYFFSRVNDNAMKYGWQFIDGYYYYFDSDGALLTGNQIIDNRNVDLDETGKLKKGILTYNTRTYYYDNYAKQLGFQEIEGKTYFFSRVSDNAMKTGMIWIDDDYYYFDVDNGMQIGLHQINDKYYYFGTDGKRKKGFQEIEGKTYFFSRVNDNAMKTGMIWIDDDYYYFDVDNGMQTGLHQINDKYYYFGTDGKRKKGFQEVEDKTYFFSRVNDNAMKTGMIWIDDDYYYFDVDNGMQTGLHQINDRYYYFGSDGKRKKGFQEIEGKTYFFSRINDNAMKYGWQLIDGYFYYFKSDGTMTTDQIDLDGINYTFTSDGKVKLTGWNSINGTRYYFNASSMVISNSVKLVIDISHHQGNINWEELHNSGQVYGVIIRLGYLDYGCKKYVDKKLKEYTDAVKRYNIPYGLYWFSYADNANEAAIEAQYTKELIRDYNLNPTLGIYYDLEYVIPNPSPIMYQNITRTYIDSMRSTYSQYNIKVYASTYFALNTIGFRGEEANNYIGWIAHWNDVNTYPYSYDMWQYSDSGRVSGINTNVDLNYYFR